jgi:phosphomannomutase/phosphoglucomutase
VAGDFRRGTLTLKERLIEGLINSSDLQILDLGQTTTPIFYFALRFLKSDWGIMITASHNPPEYNGMKIVKGILPISDEQIKEIESGINNLGSKAHDFITYKPLVIDIENEYLRSIKEKLGNLSYTREIVFDIGNGAVGKIIDMVINEFKLNATCIFKEPNPDFPSRNPNPALKESLLGLQKEIRRRKDAIGFAFDGDGDRLAVVDEKGEIVEPDIVASIFIDSLANRYDKVVFDIKSSSLVKKKILERGAVPIMERSGYPFIKKTFIEEDAILATEISGHYFFKEILQDDAIYASLKLLKILGDRPVYLLREKYKLPYITPDIRIKMNPVIADSILCELKDKFKNAIQIDGIYIEFEEGFGLIRKSITEPVLTMRFEGRDKESIKLIIEHFINNSKTLKEYEEIIRKSVE